ncbi:MAG: hypothetical protein OXK72_00445 [Gammaproteobacteria bacterium]|nr:hypothetical protein [Gammaproteobacteria bacterium]
MAMARTGIALRGCGWFCCKAYISARLQIIYQAQQETNPEPTACSRPESLPGRGKPGKR